VFKRLSRHGLRWCQKKGNITFHTAASTAFPQPAPGTAPAPGPMKEVPAAELRKYLGIRTVNYVRSKGAPALIDSTLVA
jgi:Icc protein